MTVRKTLEYVTRHYCDGCGTELNGTLYGYGTGIELGECCHQELVMFETYKYRVNYAISHIKKQPYFMRKGEQE